MNLTELQKKQIVNLTENLFLVEQKKKICFSEPFNKTQIGY